MARTTIEAGHSGTRALRGVTRYYVRRATRELQARRLVASSVHEVRKEIKKSRSALRLLRSALGEPRYRRENATLRDAARVLGAVRDAQALVQTVESLREGHRRLRRDSATAGLSRALRAERQALLQRLAAHPSPLANARHSLAQAERRARHWRVGEHGWSVLGPGIRRIYRDGRRAVPAAYPQPTEPALHEWRKQVKYLRYAARMLAPMDARLLGPLAQQAEELTDCLGRAHDLAVLAEKARAFARRQHADLRPLLEIIEREHQRLTTTALLAGERLYQLRPRQIDAQLGACWQRWRRQHTRQ